MKITSVNFCVVLEKSGSNSSNSTFFGFKQNKRALDSWSIFKNENGKVKNELSRISL